MTAKSEQEKYKLRQKAAKVDPALEEQFMSGRVLGELNQLKILTCRLNVFSSQLVSRLDRDK